MPRLQSLVSLLLLSHSLLPVVSAGTTEVVTCATSTPNPFSNPSFESGIAGWGFASGTSGNVISGDAADGSLFVETSATSTSVTVLLYQRSSAFITNGQYAGSFQYRIKPTSSHASMTCYIKAYMDSFTTAGLLGSATQSVSSSTVGWSTLSFSYYPTTSGTHTFEIYGYCTGTTEYSGAAIDLDNVQFIGPAVTSCSTQTITLTPTVTPTTAAIPTTPIEISSSQVPFPSPLSSSVASFPSPQTQHRSVPAVSPFSTVAVSIPSSSGAATLSSFSSAVSLLGSPVTIPSPSSSGAVSIAPSASGVTRSSSTVITAASSVTPLPHSGSGVIASHAGQTSGTPSTRRTTYVTATITVSETICSTSVSQAQSTAIMTAPEAPSQSNAGVTEGRSITSTVLSTRTATITACPSTVTDCPASAKSTYLTTETLVVSTTICPVTMFQSEPTPGASEHDFDYPKYPYRNGHGVSLRRLGLPCFCKEHFCYYRDSGCLNYSVPGDCFCDSPSDGEYWIEFWLLCGLCLFWLLWGLCFFWLLWGLCFLWLLYGLYLFWLLWGLCLF
ncbi:uncharacterized protein BP01DRAFT_387083 [Aspergillus saccharolyticus JOP 1030-1]|uniref:CBM-cenC domain-containing protein n=1 Tax=Aspergillus saccharolyticus JOP 1030-1 TaxID=1450539 RepID=A0A318ZKL8_9EURO|nr:hypothetical protein BP01DRAFT_387083 [Aspergillus saccharolyticus JOP 1030-1]PYH40778.1 hypothetical protein BP01DRAFT_387083 [Aspergillus saccharolyticus JOP 1030-1]